MTDPGRSDPAVVGFERRLAAVEALIPPLPVWRTGEELADRRLRVVTGSALRRRDVPQLERRGPPTVAVLAAAAMVVVVAVAGLATILTSPGIGPGHPSVVPSISPHVSESPSSQQPTVPPSLRGDALLVEDTVDGNSELYLIPLDGSSRRRLTADPEPDRDGAWTPDGSSIVFARGADGASRLYVMAANGSSARPVIEAPSEGADFDAYRPAVSPDGQSVAFIRALPSERGELWIVGIDGSAARRLVGPDHPFIADPAWTPDGRAIYLMIDDSAGGEIQINRLDVATGSLVRLDTCAGDDSEFALSPDGTRIVYQTDCGGGVWIADSDFENARHLYGTESKGYPLDWSPDGRWVAYSPPGDFVKLLDTSVTEPSPILIERGERARWRPRLDR